MDIFLSDYMNGNLEADAVPAVLRALDACRNYKDPVLKLGGKHGTCIRITPKSWSAIFPIMTAA